MPPPECHHRILKAGPYTDAHECTTCGRPFTLASTGAPCALCGTRVGCVFINSELFDDYAHEKCLVDFKESMECAGVARDMWPDLLRSRQAKWQRHKATPAPVQNPMDHKAARIAYTTLTRLGPIGDWENKSWADAWVSLCAELDTYAKEGGQ